MTPIERSKRLADALKAVGIEVKAEIIKTSWRSKNMREMEPYHSSVLLTENLMVLMDAWVKLGGHHSVSPESCAAYGFRNGLRCYEVYNVITNDDWQSALCAALVEAIEKKLGIGEG